MEKKIPRHLPVYLISSHLCPERKTQGCLHMQRLSGRQEKTPVPRSKLGGGDEEWGSECENRHPCCCMNFCSGSRFLDFCKFPFLSCCLSLCVYFITHMQILLSIHALHISMFISLVAGEINASVALTFSCCIPIGSTCIPL